MVVRNTALLARQRSSNKPARDMLRQMSAAIVVNGVSPGATGLPGFTLAKNPD
jgi:hypothetical protein